MESVNKIKQFYSREAINTGRQADVDMLKAISIIFMVVCHAVCYTNLDHDNFWNFFADEWLGAVLGAAPAFMLSMGIGIEFSRKSDPKSLFSRGWKLFLLAYVLNFFREALPSLIWRPSDFVLNLLCPDILQFAGLAFVVIALIKKLKIKSHVVLALAVVLSSIPALFYGMETGMIWLDSLISTIVPTCEDCAGFSFISWFIFVVAGMWLGDTIKRLKDADKFYARMMLPSLVVSVASLYFYFVYFDEELYYYGMTFPIALGFICASLFLLSVYHFLVKKMPEAVLVFFKTTSSNITPIFAIHWLIVGPLEIYLLVDNVGFPMWRAYLFGIVAFVVSYYIAILYKNLKKKFLCAH